MKWLKSVGREVIGLFVDDGSFAVAIVVWVGLVVLILPRFVPGARWTGPLLFVGLALIVAESVLRFSRRTK